MMQGAANARKLGFEETSHRLRDALLRATMSPDKLGAEKGAAEQNFKDLIQRICREIDETVLPRHLALICDGRNVASLVISNRRLIQMALGAKVIHPGTEEDANPDTVARHYAEALKALSAASSGLSLRVLGRAPHSTTSNTACTAMRLAQFSASSSFENRTKAFLKLIHTTSCGWIFRTEAGEAVAHNPDPALFEQLKSLEQSIVSQAKNKTPLSRVDRSGPVCSAFALNNAVQAIVATDGKNRLVAAVPLSELVSTMEQWNQVFGHRPAEP